MKKKYPEELEIDSITEGFVREKAVYDQLLISESLPHIYSQDTFFLIVYAIYPKLSRITCYPVKSSSIWKIKIISLSSNVKVISSITSLLKPFEVIHTTGISVKNDTYIVENYIVGSNNWQSAMDLVDRIGKIQNISLCSIEVIE